MWYIYNECRSSSPERICEVNYLPSVFCNAKSCSRKICLLQFKSLLKIIPKHVLAIREWSVDRWIFDRYSQWPNTIMDSLKSVHNNLPLSSFKPSKCFRLYSYICQLKTMYATWLIILRVPSLPHFFQHISMCILQSVKSKQLTRQHGWLNYLQLFKFYCI